MTCASSSPVTDAALATVVLAHAAPAARAKLAEQAWEKMVGRAVSHVLIVMKNNPHRPISWVLDRLDVRQAFHLTSQAATRRTTALIREAFEGEAQGTTPSTVLDSLLSDAARNGATAPQRLATVIGTSDSETLRLNLHRVVADLRTRAGLGVRVAEARGRAEHDLVTITASGKKKRWAAKPDACSTCLGLHGLILPVQAEFPHDTGTRSIHVYADLLCPPRHPRCRCRLQAA